MVEASLRVMKRWTRGLEDVINGAGTMPAQFRCKPGEPGSQGGVLFGLQRPGGATGRDWAGSGAGRELGSIDFSRPTWRYRNAEYTNGPRSDAKHGADDQRNRSVPDQTSRRR